MTTAVQIARFAGRLALLGVVAGCVSIVAMQFEGIVVKDLSLDRELATSRADVAALRARTQAQRATIVRLGDPHGAIPEIHEKLRLIGPHETIFYLRGSTPPPQAGDGSGTP